MSAGGKKARWALRPQPTTDHAQAFAVPNIGPFRIPTPHASDPMTVDDPAAPSVSTLANGVRVVVVRRPDLATAHVGVFVRSGSAHEPRPLNGVSHFLEHMAFKGTATRDARRINLDAETLGAEVHAHTDKDHTAFQMRGLAPDAAAFVHLLGDIVLHATFPPDELERERQVLLHEFAEVEDDPMDTAYRLFDHACFALHPAAQPVIGSRRNVERLTRDDLVAFVERQYSGSNVVVGAVGPLDADDVVREAERAFGSLRSGAPNQLTPPAYRGGVRARALAGSGQAHLVLGFALPPLCDDDGSGELAAAVFGEGMSSPLLQRVREQRALAYHATCAADVLDPCGQFVVEASTAPELAEPLLQEVAQLLRRHAEVVETADLERARRQLRVRRLRAHERPMHCLEDAALDLFAFGRVRSPAQRLAQLHAIEREAVRALFERMLAAGPAAALVGRVGRGAGQRAQALLAAAFGDPPAPAGR
jgi:predicted Zn-dependent peptidase